MSSVKKIVWVDDNPDRAPTAAVLGAQFVDVRGKDPGPELKKLLEGPSPRLVIIDHVLDKTTGTHPLFLRGSTIAEAIKEKWPSCPVIGVTNAGKLRGIDLRTQEAYDALFPFHNFGKYFGRITGIARGFALLAKTDSDIRALLKLLKPVEDETDRLLDALTDDLKGSMPDPSVASRIYRWVEHLMERPGFLFDPLWSATFLGLNETGFQRVGRRFETAKYRGVFARPDEPLWWSSGLSDRLYKLCPPEPGELSWQVGRRLPGIKRQHFSSCYYCKEEFPETVAFLDEASSDHVTSSITLPK